MTSAGKRRSLRGMARIAVIGGGAGGLTAALLLGRDGHRVTLLERDPAPPVAPADAFDGWVRTGVPQFRLTHVLLPRLRELLDDELPDVVAALLANGALRTNRMVELPSTVSGGFRPTDARFEQITGRRPMVEATLAAVLDDEPDIAVRRGVAVTGIEVGEARPAGVPHVAGVVLGSGERIPTDLVVGAGGRRSNVPHLLGAIGVHPLDEVAEHGCRYFCRTFRSRGAVPALVDPPVHHHDTISIVTAPADNDTWSLAVAASATDHWARRAVDPATWTGIVRAFPHTAPWLDGEALTGVETMTALPDRRSRYVVDGRPVVTGFVAIGDTLASTSPTYGRGVTFAAMGALCLRDVLREVAATDAAELAHRWYDRIGNIVTPLIDDTLVAGRHRLAEMEAQLAGRPYETDDATWPFMRRLSRAAAHDPEVLRAAMSVAGGFERVRDAARRRDLAARLDALGPLAPAPGPTRAELERLVDSSPVAV
jgi:2-polyprenyl-6-methoxyphenol hydroxylase-like FAD-dependent oxidoreductase